MCKKCYSKKKAVERVQISDNRYHPQFDAGQSVPVSCNWKEMGVSRFQGLQADCFPVVMVWLRK